MRTEHALAHLLPPPHVNWLNSVATVYLQSGQYEKAQPLLQLLVALNPKDSKPLKRLAYLHYKQGQFEEALRCCQRYEQFLEPIDLRIYLLRSFCYLSLNQPEQAKIFYQRFTSSRTVL